VLSERIEKVNPRVLVAVDVMNVWYTGRYQFGDGTRINYAKLVELLTRTFPNLQLTLLAYTVSATTRRTGSGKIKTTGPRNQKFIASLTKLGFHVKDRTMVSEKNAAKPFGTDWDVGITLDAMKEIDNYDTFVLVSGDGDYALLLAELKKQGKRVEVITFESSASRLLHQEADKVTYLTENEIFNTGSDYGENQADPS
jgi:uncharacterized LabA/DUF88 family protein